MNQGYLFLVLSLCLIFGTPKALGVKSSSTLSYRGIGLIFLTLSGDYLIDLRWFAGEGGRFSVSQTVFWANLSFNIGLVIGAILFFFSIVMKLSGFSPK
jgi:hypothetical protein